VACQHCALGEEGEVGPTIPTSLSKPLTAAPRLPPLSTHGCPGLTGRWRCSPHPPLLPHAPCMGSSNFDTHRRPRPTAALVTSHKSQSQVTRRCRREVLTPPSCDMSAD